MRITLENTVSEPQYSQKVMIEVPYDDVDLEEMCHLFDQLLWGFGFHPKGQLEVVNPDEK